MFLLPLSECREVDTVVQPPKCSAGAQVVVVAEVHAHEVSGSLYSDAITQYFQAAIVSIAHPSLLSLINTDF